MQAFRFRQKLSLQSFNRQKFYVAYFFHERDPSSQRDLVKVTFPVK